MTLFCTSSERQQAEKWGARVTALEVETITLTKLLDDLGITEIDLLSMDIEGAEPLALEGFDIARFKPKLVCIELQGKHADAYRQGIRDYFESHQYEQIEQYLAFDKVNWYFAPR